MYTKLPVLRVITRAKTKPALPVFTKIKKIVLPKKKEKSKENI